MSDAEIQELRSDVATLRGLVDDLRRDPGHESSLPFQACTQVLAERVERLRLLEAAG